MAVDGVAPRKGKSAANSDVEDCRGSERNASEGAGKRAEATPPVGAIYLAAAAEKIAGLRNLVCQRTVCTREQASTGPATMA